MKNLILLLVIFLSFSACTKVYYVFLPTEKESIISGKPNYLPRLYLDGGVHMPSFSDFTVPYVPYGGLRSDGNIFRMDSSTWIGSGTTIGNSLILNDSTKAK